MEERFIKNSEEKEKIKAEDLFELATIKALREIKRKEYSGELYFEMLEEKND